MGDDPATEDSGDDKIFAKLAVFVLGRLTVAHSTAAVERIFSIVSCVKSKQRNRLRTSTLEAVLRFSFYSFFLHHSIAMLSISQVYRPRIQFVFLKDIFSCSWLK